MALFSKDPAPPPTAPVRRDTPVPTGGTTFIGVNITVEGTISGSEPVVVNSAGIYAALKAGTVDAQENPLALIELFELYEVVRYISMSNHIWSGFNELAHLATWRRLPAGVQTVIESNVAKHVRLQRQRQAALNSELRTTLARQGPVFNDVDQTPFRRMLAGVYEKWKAQLGARCWSLLEAETGRLA